MPDILRKWSALGKGKAHEHQSRRNAIEAVIGHMKTDGLLSGNRLLGREGDRINAILCGAGQNLRLILKKLRLLFGSKCGLIYTRH